jgi:hypothetical protein
MNKSFQAFQNGMVELRYEVPGDRREKRNVTEPSSEPA